MSVDPNRIERFGKRGADFYQGLVTATATAYGDRPSQAEPLSHEKELEVYMLPTSPAAQEAIKRGGSIEDVEEANRLYANHLKQQQQQMAAAGATPEQLKQAELTDDDIFRICHAHGWERGKAHAGTDEAKRAAYHARMTERARQKRAERSQMAYQTVGGEGVG